MMKISVFVVFAMFSSGFAFGNEMSNPCVYHPNLPGCSGNNRPIGQTTRVINISNRWGAVYYNAANQAIGYSENNTEGYRSANKEALANCIEQGGGNNPLDRKGQGCHKLVEYRNSCAAIAMGGEIGRGRVSGRSGYDYVKDAEKAAIEGCEDGKSFKCTVRYSGCSRHPDYRY